MKRCTINFLLILFTYCLGIFHFSYAAKNSCEIRQKEIEKQIEEAKSFGNYYQVLGLEKAWREVATYCKKDIKATRKNSQNEKKRNKK